jgi:hypothetical protein
VNVVSVVHIPLTIDPEGLGLLVYGAYLSAGDPATPASTNIQADDPVPSSIPGPQPLAVDVVDLTPGTTYHYRLYVAGTLSAMTDDATFTVPPLGEPAPPPGDQPTTATTASVPIAAPPPPPARKVHFRLSSSAISIVTLSHGSHTATVRLRRLPARTKVKLTLTIGARHITITRTASSAGTITFTIKLSKALRAALASHSRTSFRVTVSVTPPGDSASSISKTSKLKVVKHKKKQHHHHSS